MEEGMNDDMNQETIKAALRLYASSFEKVLYEEDETFLEGMKKNSLACDDIRALDSSVTGSCLRPPARSGICRF